VLIALSLVPILLIALILVLTDCFSVHPKLPTPFSRITPLILAAVTILTSFFVYHLARDEEPEWSNALVYKIIEGAAVAYIVVSLIFSLMIAMYMLPF